MVFTIFQKRLVLQISCLYSRFCFTILWSGKSRFVNVLQWLEKYFWSFFSNWLFVWKSLKSIFFFWLFYFLNWFLYDKSFFFRTFYRHNWEWFFSMVWTFTVLFVSFHSIIERRAYIQLFIVWEVWVICDLL